MIPPTIGHLEIVAVEESRQGIPHGSDGHGNFSELAGAENTIVMLAVRFPGHERIFSLPVDGQVYRSVMGGKTYY